MFSPRTMNFIQWAFEHGSFLRILPYKWNNSKLKLEDLNSKYDYILLNLTDTCFCGYIFYITLGLLTSFPFRGFKENNSAIIVHVLIITATLLCSSILIFRRVKRKQIVHGTNQLMAYVKSFEGIKYVNILKY